MYEKIRKENLEELVKSGIVIKDAKALQNLCRILHEMDEIRCSEDLGSEENYAKFEREVEVIENLAEDIAKKYGFISYHQGDPRGWSLYLVRPEQLGEYSIDVVYDRGIGVTIW